MPEFGFLYEADVKQDARLLKIYAVPRETNPRYLKSPQADAPNAPDLSASGAHFRLASSQ